MTLGEKIAKGRKELNYTQEQLADILGVSRQSISKWESDGAYPETDKLVKMGKMFGCSMDYLLNDERIEKDGIRTEDEDPMLGKIRSTVRKQVRERKSEKMVWGMPLYHIGRDAKGFLAVGLNAKGIIAIGMKAKGIVSLGMFSMGVLSFGLLSLGLVAFGALSFGLLSVGSIAAGLFAAGAISMGVVSFGALSIGEFSAGAWAMGKYIAVGDHAQAMIAIGGSEAMGGVYQHAAGSPSVDMIFVKEWLDTNVPSYLGWAKDIFMFFIG